MRIAAVIHTTISSGNSVSGSLHPRSSSQPSIVRETESHSSPNPISPWFPPVRERALRANRRTASAAAIVAIAK